MNIRMKAKMASAGLALLLMGPVCLAMISCMQEKPGDDHKEMDVSTDASSVASPEDWEELGPTPEGYTLEQARRDGYVIQENGKATWGLDIWDRFWQSTRAGTPAKVRVVHYYTLPGPEGIESTLYEKMKDEYPALYIMELIYDGTSYTCQSYEEETLYQYTFAHLLCMDGDGYGRRDESMRTLEYVLVDDDTATWDDVVYTMISSISEGTIRFRQVLSIPNAKK